MQPRHCCSACSCVCVCVQLRLTHLLLPPTKRARAGERPPYLPSHPFSAPREDESLSYEPYRCTRDERRVTATAPRSPPPPRAAKSPPAAPPSSSASSSSGRSVNHARRGPEGGGPAGRGPEGGGGPEGGAEAGGEADSLPKETERSLDASLGGSGGGEKQLPRADPRADAASAAAAAEPMLDVGAVCVRLRMAIELIAAPLGLRSTGDWLNESRVRACAASLRADESASSHRCCTEPLRETEGGVAVFQRFGVDGTPSSLSCTNLCLSGIVWQRSACLA